MGVDMRFAKEVQGLVLAVAMTIGVSCVATAAGKPVDPPVIETGAYATDPARLDPPHQELELDFEHTLKRVREFRGKQRSGRPTVRESLPLPVPDDGKTTTPEPNASVLATEPPLVAGELPQPLPPAAPSSSSDVTAKAEQTAKGPVFDKVDRDWGLRPFMKNGYQPMVEPRISFIKRKDMYSEVVEYSWLPLIIKEMPNRERIDRVQFSFNRYYFTGPERKIFYGGGLGGNIILFSHDLKTWGTRNNINLKDGVNGLGRLFFGYKFSEFKFNRWTYPVVFRVDAMFSPAYKFGGLLGEAGDRLELSEIKAGLSLGIE